MRLAPMMRTVDIILLLALVCVVSWTFQVKHESQVALERVAELEKQIAAERVEIDLLKSDWSLLTSPARLQELVERYAKQLELEPMAASQMTSEKEIYTLHGTETFQSSSEQKAQSIDTIDTFSNTGSVRIPVPQPRGTRP